MLYYYISDQFQTILSHRVTQKTMPGCSLLVWSNLTFPFKPLDLMLICFTKIKKSTPSPLKEKSRVFSESLCSDLTGHIRGNFMGQNIRFSLLFNIDLSSGTLQGLKCAFISHLYPVYYHHPCFVFHDLWYILLHTWINHNTLGLKHMVMQIITNHINFKCSKYRLDGCISVQVLFSLWMPSIPLGKQVFHTCYCLITINSSLRLEMSLPFLLCSCCKWF